MSIEKDRPNYEERREVIIKRKSEVVRFSYNPSHSN
jgi:hypothetical protein